LYPSTSALTILPPGPEPDKLFNGIPLSAAIFLAKGLAKTRPVEEEDISSDSDDLISETSFSVDGFDSFTGLDSIADLSATVGDGADPS